MIYEKCSHSDILKATLTQKCLKLSSHSVCNTRRIFLLKMETTSTLCAKR